MLCEINLVHIFGNMYPSIVMVSKPNTFVNFKFFGYVRFSLCVLDLKVGHILKNLSITKEKYCRPMQNKILQFLLSCQEILSSGLEWLKS